MNRYTCIECHGLTLSADQAVVLATQNHDMRLTLRACEFNDGGVAFIDALQSRESRLTALVFDEKTGLSDVSLKRLLQLDKIKSLTLPSLEDELALLPFSARVDYLDYTIFSSSLLVGELQSLNIVTTELSLTISHNISAFPTASLTSLFRRLAELGHLQVFRLQLKVRLDLAGIRREPTPDAVVEELIRAALANEGLRVLDLGDRCFNIDWGPHIKTLFEGLKDHKGLRSIKMDVDDKDFGDDYKLLRQFLLKTDASK
ncbi:hypothetical protein FisN_24Hu035 [Fistulifera solaris]|uniref:Uncharacterized protein n=1 Tax=Fistulifera solaris TaxID=1519565 RepID=A0A1Z5JFC7_FISSO|nr:hypothetical protein FisN_24Hu035 [Fistulifera solaris]|eukprot:GAX12461.1 hypothetical protein FisN_24Hu035 [Fistulifera solaris]